MRWKTIGPIIMGVIFAVLFTMLFMSMVIKAEIEENRRSEFRRCLKDDPERIELCRRIVDEIWKVKGSDD